jgi:hypothetical protein
LALPVPILRAYRWETVVAEKSEAMVTLGMANTRMKDFFDLWYLPRANALDPNLLRYALAATFERSGTEWPDKVPDALTTKFSEDPQKQLQWKGEARS